MHQLRIVLHRMFQRLSLGLVWLLSALLVVTACGSSTPVPITPQIAPERVREVCWKPEELGPKVVYFVFPGEDGKAIEATGAEHDGFIFKYNENAPPKNLLLLPLSRPEAWCTNVPRPTDPEVLRLLDPCAVPLPASDVGSGAKPFLGQTSEAQIRSPFFCGKMPQMTPTTQETILKRSRNDAYLDAYTYAHQTAMALTQANAEMEAVNHNGYSWVKRLFVASPGTLEQIQQRVADALDKIGAPPDVEDPNLENIALAGFNAGFENGKFEVEAKLFAIDAGVVILEAVAIEVALGPLGGAKLLTSVVSKGAKALTSAVQRLENIPIFVPLANGGTGAFISVGKIIGSISVKAHRYRLKRALEVVFKRKKLASESTHHIVPLESNVGDAAECRKLFKDFKLDIDAEYNGVFLPAYKNSPNPAGAIVHATLDNKRYYAIVLEALGKAKSQGEAMQTLHRIRETLLNGTFYDAVL